MEQFPALQIYESVPSTNDVLQQLAEAGAPTGTAIAAQQQTAGKGRMGRTFFSPLGTGLYLSVLVRPQLPPTDALLLTPMAAVATADAIAAVTGKSVQIKWVNDLLREGKKLCGILVQSKIAADGTLDYAIIGIGINLMTPHGGFPPALAEVATALYTESETPPAQLFESLAQEIVSRLLVESEHLLERRFLTRYRARLCILHTPILVVNTVDAGEQAVPAVALDLDENLRLLVRYADGSEQWRSTGEIRIRLT